ncbi:MAG: tetratricopeptide repeat protein, partial [Patescibacteria group bacterium]|nr:tetratricopeptide repeat protein [Patescibacteria group bacterium]
MKQKAEQASAFSSKDFSTKKLLLLLSFIGLVTYATSLLNGFVWDDFHFFLQNVFTGSLKYIPQIFTSNTTAGAGVSSNYYRPLSTFSFAIDHLLWFGWNPFGMHLTNMVMHILNGCLLFLWFVRLGIRKTVAFFISVIFLVHPIQTEAVTYLSSRGDILYTLFLFLSLYLYTYSLYTEKLVLTFRKWRLTLSYQVLLLLSVLLFPLAILSKEGALTTGPMYVGVLIYFFVQQKITVKKCWMQYRDHVLVIIPLLFITLFYFYLRLTFLNFGDTLNYADSQGLYATSLLVRLYTFAKVFLLDIGLLAFPYPLYLERDTTIVTTFLSPWVLGAVGVVVGMIFAGIWEIKKRKSALIFFSLILIFANLLSVSGIIPMTGLIRENWLYVPMVGFYTIAVVIAGLVFPQLAKFTGMLFWGSVVVTSIYIAMTINQNTYWKNNITYLSHNLDYTNTSRLHLNLGNAYMQIGQYNKAFKELKEAEKLGDYYPQTHYNLGTIYLHEKKNDLAEKEFLISLDLD